MIFKLLFSFLAKGQRKELQPVDMIYKPARLQNEIMECFFSKNIRAACRGTHNKKDKLEHVMPYECYYCSNFFALKRDFDNHIKICNGKPSVVYDFHIQNVVTFEDNIKYKGGIPLCAYADFETSAPTEDCLNLENRSMFAVFYAIVFAWHPKLNLKRQMVVRGYNHSLSELGDMSYLTNEQLAMRNQKTAEQLRDTVIKVHFKKNKNAIAEMFNIELKFTCDILMRWFNYKTKSSRLSVPNISAIECNRYHPITAETKCCICNFPLDTAPKRLEFEGNEMSYLDFLIKKEHALIRNIYDKSDLKKSKNIASEKIYYDTMVLFIHLVRVTENEIKTALHFMVFTTKN